MRSAATSLEIWLPPVSHWPPDSDVPARWLARADVTAPGPVDIQAAIEQAFATEPVVELPVAALLRQYLAGDAGDANWLAADPAWIQPDMNGARLLACQHMQLSRAEAEALGRDLQLVFAEQGILLQLSDPHYWQLRLPEGMPVPVLVPPSQAMGADVLAFLPAGSEGRRWRQLWNEAQTVLHAHPVNQQRLARGLPPVNSVWFWGGGRLPSRLASRWQAVLSEDPVLLAAASAAGLAAHAYQPSSLEQMDGAWLLDLQMVDAEHWPAWMQALTRLAPQMPLRWRLADGRGWQWRAWHRWRYWRSPWTG